MKASELRIGNLVYNTKNEYAAINLVVLAYILNEPRHQVKPIPLTEEILLKCGFEKSIVESWNIEISIIWAEDISSNKVLYIKYDKDYKFYWYGIEDYALDAVAISRIQYLHQLQNLYFALTNKELQIEL